MEEPGRLQSMGSLLVGRLEFKKKPDKQMWLEEQKSILTLENQLFEGRGLLL